MTWESRRRPFLQGLLVTAAGSLAGCSSDSSSSDEEDDEPADEEPTAAQTTDRPAPDEPEPTTSSPTQTPTPTPVANPEEKLDRWLKNAQNYDGEILDKRSEQRVTVSVGADGRKGFDGFAFDPPAIRITTGTEVTWLWTGKGGKHNVRDRRGRFDSGAPEDGGGTTFIHTFETPGLYRYKCTNHGDALNMRGALIVDY